MQTQFKHPYLVRRGKGGFYCFRRDIPERLRRILGKREFNITFGDADLQEVLPRYHEAAANVERQLQAAQAEFTRSLDRGSAEHQPTVPPASEPPKQRFWFKPTHPLPPQRPCQFQGLPAFAPAIFAKQRLDPRVPVDASGPTAIVTSARPNPMTDRRGPGYADFAEIAHALQKLLATAPEVLAPTLSKFTDDYIAERGNSLSRERAEDQIRPTVRALIAVVGDKPMTAYTVTDRETFKRVLLALPANWSKVKDLRRLTIVAAAESARERGLKPQTVGNIKKKWQILTSLFERAAVTYTLKNPFVANALALSDKVPANRRKDIFEPNELTALLKSDLTRHLYWLTWLGLYTGARLNELCQLRKSHVLRHGEIAYLYFSPELRLKTGELESCVRAVPIHSELVRKGFLDYVASCNDELFPGIPVHRRTGRLSHEPSKWFSRHLEAIGLKRERLSFHSLRKTFAARLMTLAPADFETRERLTGHGTPGVAAHYRNSYEAEAHDKELLAHRAKVVELLRY